MEAQKGTCGMIFSQEEMPYNRDGISPDLIVNPHAYPSRMTIGQLIECLMGKAAACLGARMDGTPFQNYNVDEIGNILQSVCGWERMGNEVLYHGHTGEQIDAMVFMGPTYYLSLKHMVQDKVHCLTPDHEVLTSTGWKPIASIQMEDKVAILKDGKTEFENPLDIYKYENNKEKELYTVETSEISLTTTTNHRMWVSVDGGNTFTWKEAAECDKVDCHYLTMEGKPVLVPMKSGRFYTSNEPVYCLRVSTEVFLVKRDNKAVWTGNSRSNGPSVLLTRQPTEGRSRDGGLRIGEMERDVILSHGIMQFLKERLFDCSDKYFVSVCKETGMIAAVNPEAGVYKSLYSEDNSTDFVKVQLPYASKLFIQEMMGFGLAPRMKV
jgi:hypothetical protein